MDYLRRGCRIDHIRNSEIRRQMDGFEKASEKMKKRLRWYRHVRRMKEQRWAVRLFEWRSQERRKRGRPEQT
jgi:hypothetical protein